MPGARLPAYGWRMSAVDMPVLEIGFLVIGIIVAVLAAWTFRPERRERPSDRYDVPR